ncbi:MAG: ParB/RepB/Spo0J family partition protein [Christensenellaceae bacterium]|jgi:ParB family chromosome partitioning protein|nr:ParB/RepB/Spo0J family partition protein [Christensenellaceae bacterium]
MNKLGKGLGALFGENLADIDNRQTEEGKEGVKTIPINKIDNNINQPRKTFNENAMAELTDSIKEHGVIQPIIVVPVGERYMIVAGERRWRASKAAGLNEVPAIIKDYTDKQIAEISIIENLQRDGLNEIELAIGIKKLMDEFNLTQEKVAERIGKTRSTVANLLRILSLQPEIQKMIAIKQLSYGHAIRLMSVEDNERQLDYAKAAIKGGLSVRALEQLVDAAEKRSKTKNLINDKNKNKSTEIIEQEKLLAIKLNTKVEISGSNHIGKIIINYFSKDELERIIENILQNK